MKQNNDTAVYSSNLVGSDASSDYAEGAKKTGKSAAELQKMFPNPRDMRIMLSKLRLAEGLSSELDEANAEWIMQHTLQGEIPVSLKKLYLLTERLHLPLAELTVDEINTEASTEEVAVYSQEKGLNPATVNGMKHTGLTLDQLRAETDQLSVSAVAAAATPTITYPDIETPTDPRAAEHDEAPFGYNYQNNESVSLNSGSLSWQTTDFVVPGKNGLNLEIGRCFSSSQCNEQEVDIKVEKNKLMYFYTIYFKYQWRQGSTSYPDTFDIKHWDGPYLNQSDRNAIVRDRMEDYEGWRVVHEDGMVEIVTVERDMQSKRMTNYTTGTRTNNHLLNTFGLGYGWSLNLPSIEAIPELSKKDEVEHYDFVHLGDGRMFKIVKNPTSTTGSNLHEYELTDIRIQKFTNQTVNIHGTTSNYDYILFHKDGRKQYFLNGKIICTEDRFGNQIGYRLNANGGGTITDSMGNLITLAKAGTSSDYTLTWNLPDSSKIIYRIQNNRLIQVTDQMGRTTKFSYAINTVRQQYFKSISGDQGAPITYHNLSGITHPTGAQTSFAYSSVTQKITSPENNDAYIDAYSRQRVFNTIASREDSYSGKPAQNRVTYSFRSTQERDSYKRKKYYHYINTADVTRDGLLSTSTFNHEAQNMRIQTTRSGRQERVVSFIYHQKYKHLPRFQTTTVYGTNTMSYTEEFDYDPKGNVTQHVNAKGITTDYTYHQTYGFLLTKSFPQTNSMIVEEIHEPRSDGKAIQHSYVYVNKVMKEHREVLYDSNNNPTQLRQYYGSLRGNDYYVKHFVYTGPFVTEVRSEGVLDADGNLIKSPYGPGIVRERSTFSVMGHKLTHQGPDAEGDVTTYAYDALGRLECQTNPDGTEVRRDYDDDINVIMLTDENKHRTKTVYSPLGKVTATFDEDNGVKLVEYEYDNMGRIKNKIINKPGGGVRSKQTTTYDPYDRPMSKTLYASDGRTILEQERYSYDDAATTCLSKITVTKLGDSDAPNIVTATYLDELGRKLQESVMENGVERICKNIYDNSGNRTFTLTALDQQRGLAHTTKWTYDHAGRVLSETNALNQVTRSEYDALGNLVSSTSIAGGKAAQPYSTLYRHDAMGRVLVKRMPFESLGNKIQYAQTRYDYAPSGKVIREYIAIHRAGEPERYRVSEHRYDLRGRLMETVTHGEENQAALLSRYEYDGVGNQTKIACGDSMVKMTYDRFGNMTSRTDALEQVETFEYDAIGLLSHKTDRNGNLSSYTYDDAGRIVKETVRTPDGDVANNEQGYTLIGGTRWISNDELHIEYKYDSLGRLTQETESTGVIKNYGYDSGGNRTSFRLNRNGFLLNLTYEYDNLNRLSVVKNDGLQRARYSYDDNGNRSSLQLQNGMRTNYRYNLADHNVELVNRRANGETVSSYAYEYQLDGNQIAKTDMDGKTTRYEYDRVGRLTREDDGETAMLYEYDERGNRSRMTFSGEEAYVEDYHYDLNNRLLETVRTGENVEERTYYRYDRNGNELSKLHQRLESADDSRIPAISLKDGLAVLERNGYNGMNQLVTAVKGGRFAAYSYRPDGMRHAKTVDRQTLQHLWDGQEMVAECTRDGVLTARYLRGIGLLERETPQATGLSWDQLEAQISSWDEVGNSSWDEIEAIKQSTSFYLFNGHGDVVQLADSDGNLTRSYEYDAFGVEVEPRDNDDNPFRYCGEYFDQETETIYLRARYYNPRVGRFGSEDPARDQLNWYSYCSNNPIKFADPLGLSIVGRAVDAINNRLSTSTIGGNRQPSPGGGSAGAGGGGLRHSSPVPAMDPITVAMDSYPDLTIDWQISDELFFDRNAMTYDEIYDVFATCRNPEMRANPGLYADVIWDLSQNFVHSDFSIGNAFHEHYEGLMKELIPDGSVGINPGVLIATVMHESGMGTDPRAINYFGDTSLGRQAFTFDNFKTQARSATNQYIRNFYWGMYSSNDPEFSFSINAIHASPPSTYTPANFAMFAKGRYTTEGFGALNEWQMSIVNRSYY